MPALFKLLLAGGALVSLPHLTALGETPATVGPVVAAATTTQNPVQDPASSRAEARWNFAILTYRPRGADKFVELAARNLTKLWVLERSDGRVCLEIVHKNSDYSFVEIEEFHLLRRSDNVSASEVPVIRTSLGDMAFPAFK